MRKKEAVELKTIDREVARLRAVTSCCCLITYATHQANARVTYFSISFSANSSSPSTGASHFRWDGPRKGDNINNHMLTETAVSQTNSGLGWIRKKNTLAHFYLQLPAQFPLASTLQSSWIANISTLKSNLFIWHTTNRWISSVQPLNCLAALKSFRRREKKQQHQQQLESCPSSSFPLTRIPIGSSAHRLSSGTF